MKYEKELLKKLIQIPSISGQENAVGKYLFNLLTKCGFETKKYPVKKDRYNVVAKIGNPKIYLSAHMDTVAPVLEYRETKTQIFGRGSCDTKASIATMITAAINAKKQGIKNIGLIFTVGEESTLDGAKAIVKSKINIPFVIVGEPTSMEIVNGHFGILVIKISAKGKSSHSSRPEKGINAINILLETINKVKGISLYSETLMSLVQINGGIADNIIPDEANAVFSFRISPKDNNNYPKIFKSFETKNLKVSILQEVKPISCKVPKELSFIKIIRTVKYFTELSFYKNGVVLGPGDIQYAHGKEEMIEKKELSKAVNIYTKTLENFSNI